jgi:predicted HTH domain antitoxin
MPVLITDDLLTETGMSERDAKVEIACRLFAAGRWPLPAATRWTGLSRVDFERELVARGLPLVRVDDEYWRLEEGSLDQLKST